MMSSVPRIYQIIGAFLLILLIAFFALPRNKQDGPELAETSGATPGSAAPPTRLSGLQGESVAARKKRELEEDKETFFEARNINSRAPGSVSINDPTVLFWIDRLAHPDAEKRQEAVRTFEHACVNPPRHGIYWPAPPDLSKDEQTIRHWLESTTVIATIESDENASPNPKKNNFREAGSLGTLAAQPDLMKLVAAFATRLEDPSTAKSARDVIDGFTMHIYEGKSPEWWQNKFPKSHLASIFLNQSFESQED